MTNSDFAGVHLCGSLPFDSGEQAFRWIGDEMKPWVRRVPDETGERAGWVFTQYPLFAENPAFEPAPVDPNALVPIPKVRPKASVDPRSIEFAPFGYAAAAKASYELFERARDDGTLPADARFLFAMPSPFNPVSLFVVSDAQADVLPAYEAQARTSVEQVLEALPHASLSIQWDVPIEVVTWEGWVPNVLEGRDEIVDLLARLGSWIPEDVELGYHLCYGDSDVHPREKEPADARTLAELWNALVAAVPRAIQFVHMPTAIGWVEPEHYRPLANIDLSPDTDFYLGVVHHQDGLEGGRRRTAAAASVLDRPFGISTECGMGRYKEKQSFRTCVDALRTLAENPQPVG